MHATRLTRLCFFSAFLLGCGRDQRDLIPVPKSPNKDGLEDPTAPRANIEASGGADSSAGGAPTTSGAGGSETANSSGGNGGALTEPVPLLQPILFEGVRLPDGSTDSLLVDNGTVDRFRTDSPTPASIVDGRALWVFPGFVDSHVHLTYLPRARDLASAGVLAAVDLAAPLESLMQLPTDLHLLPAGPMITSFGGYPTQSWGRNGYGWEVLTAEEARSAVTELTLLGAQLIKVPLDGDNTLTDEQITAIVAVAHQAGLKVAAHALTLDGAERAATLGCDLFAHTPAEELTDEVVNAFSDRAVISTVRAFGASETTKDNLRRLHAAGATVLYGTDFGNTQLAAIDTQELLLLLEIGLSAAETLEAATTVPSSYWGIDEGAWELGGAASFLLLRSDPTTDISVLSSPEYTFFRGTQLRGPNGNVR